MASNPNVAQCQQRLRSAFQNQQFDDDVVVALLEMHNQDISAVIKFLTAQEGDPPPFQPTNDGIPSDYFKEPAGYAKQRAQIATTGGPSAEDLRFKSLFLQESNFTEHLLAQRDNYPVYVSVLLLLVKQRVDITSTVKGRVLAACWARRDFELAQHLLSLSEQFGLPEVLKAVTLLDAPRRIRQMQSKITRCQRTHAKAATIGRLQSLLNDLRADACLVRSPTFAVSMTGAQSKRVRAWVRSIPPDMLTFYALSLPKEPWQELADVVHLCNDDFQVPWFLPVAFGADPPQDSVLARCANVTVENLLSLCRDFQLPYSYIRRALPESVSIEHIPDEIKTEIAKYEKLGTVLWWYEDLVCPGVDRVIAERLARGDVPDLAYGKMMERLLVLQRRGAPFLQALIPIAETRLKSVSLPLDPPVVVLGDASFSMDVAIRTATIISSVLCFLADADLKFFHNECFAAPMVPRTIPQVLEVATNTKAEGLTAPAAALWHYYTRKEVVKVFVLVTDEIENIPYHGFYFAQLFVKYYAEVFPAKIVFVSFLEKNQAKGRMVQALEQLGINPLQFRLDQTRPDLTKLDALIGIMSAETDFFRTSIGSMAASLSSKGLGGLVPGAGAGASAAAAGAGRARNVAPVNVRAPAAAGSSNPPQTPGAEHVCRVCLDLPNDYAVVPCGHQVLCENCKAARLDSCPVCRGAISSIIKIFKS